MVEEWCEQFTGSCDAQSRTVVSEQLALVQGILLLVLGLVRGGFLLRFFSRPLTSAFLFAAAIITMVSQFEYILFNNVEKLHIGKQQSSSWWM